MKKTDCLAGAPALRRRWLRRCRRRLRPTTAKLEQLKAQGFARVAIANEPPFTAVAADGKVSGAAPDVAREVFKRLGVDDIVASISEYGAMIPGLQAGRSDVVTAGLFMKPERCAAVAYSEPILCDAEAFAGQEGQSRRASRAMPTSPRTRTPRSARRAAAPRRSWRSKPACRATASSSCRTARAA